MTVIEFPQEKFSVCQFFEDGSYEYVRRFVEPVEAVKAFMHYTNNVAARIGTTRRVIITDAGDCITFEWKFEEGIVFPVQLIDEKSKPG